MLNILQREMIYLWYYFTVQLEQIFPYWLLGMGIGSIISVFGKEKIHRLFDRMKNKRMGLFGVIPACILGIASPLCMYGTIPIAASFSEKGMRDDWLASFMMSSILHDHRTRDQDHQSGSPEDRAGDTAFSALSGLCYGIFTVDWNDSESGCLDH